MARDIGNDRYATTEVHNCGATADYVTVVRVGRGAEPQSDTTEVFVADSNHGAAQGGQAGAIWINVTWTAPGKLSVVYANDARIFKNRAEAQGASIRYKGSAPFAPPVPILY